MFAPTADTAQLNVAGVDLVFYRNRSRPLDGALVQHCNTFGSQPGPPFLTRSRIAQYASSKHPATSFSAS
jgi:hypothetical protein